MQLNIVSSISKLKVVVKSSRCEPKSRINKTCKSVDKFSTIGTGVIGKSVISDGPSMDKFNTIGTGVIGESVISDGNFDCKSVDMFDIIGTGVIGESVIN